MEEFTIEEMFEIVKHDVRNLEFDLISIAIPLGNNASWNLAKKGICFWWRF